MNVVQRVAANVRRLRTERLGSVEQSSEISFKYFGDDEGISIPRWYRLEQGTHPGMLGDILDTVSNLLQVDAAILVMDPKESATAALNSKKKPRRVKKSARSHQKKRGGNSRR